MGVIDMVKMARKAQEAKSKMSALTAAGRSKSGKTAILLNGLNEMIEISFAEELRGASTEELGDEVMQAFNDARKQLEQELAGSMDMDSLRDMLGA